jgi:hypothetical protein
MLIIIFLISAAPFLNSYRILESEVSVLVPTIALLACICSDSFFLFAPTITVQLTTLGLRVSALCRIMLIINFLILLHHFLNSYRILESAVSVLVTTIAFACLHLQRLLLPLLTTLSQYI